MGEALDHDLSRAGGAERRWSALDDVIGVGLLVLAGGCIAFSLVGAVSGIAGHRVHPDAVLLPLAAAVPLAGAGAFFRLAAYAMRRHAPGRWRAQWAAIGLPLILAFFMWLSVA